MKKQYGSGIMIEDSEQRDLLHKIMSVTDSDDEEWFHNELKDPEQMNFSNFLKDYLEYRKDKMKQLASNQIELDKYQDKTFDLMKEIKIYFKTRKLIHVDIANLKVPTHVPKGGKRRKTKKRRKTIKKGGKKKRKKVSRKKTKKRRSSKR